MDGDHCDGDDSDKNNKFRTTTNVISSETKTTQYTSASSEPIPSTSVQSIGGVVSSNLISNFPNDVLIKQEPEPEPSAMVMDTVQTVQCDKSTVTSGQLHLTSPLKKNIEQLSIPQQFFADPSKRTTTTISNQNNTSVPNVIGNKSITAAEVFVQPKPTTPKRFIKCVSKDGKVSLMELIQDESNPKLFKMILPKSVNTSKVGLKQPQQQLQLPRATNAVLTTASMQPPIKIGTVLANPSSGKVVPIIRTSNSVSSNANIPSASLNLTTIPSLSGLSSQSMNKPNIVIGGNLSLNGPSTSTILPKLVAVNSSTPMTPTAQPTSSTQSLSPHMRIIKKNNKIFVVDSQQLQKTQSQQQTVRKPQVSLLKPRPTTAIGSSVVKKITVTNIPGIEYKNINVYVPNDIQIASKSIFKAKHTSAMRPSYSELLEKRFIARNTYSNMTEAISWLLKAIPLVTPLASQLEFRESFPFVVSSMAEFSNLNVVKQRSFEVIFVIERRLLFDRLRLFKIGIKMISRP